MSQLVHGLYEPVQPSDHRPLAEQVADHLRGLIERETLRGGDRLPPTRDLAARLGVNRGVVLKAIRILENEGTLRARVGSGVTVVARERAAGAHWEPSFSAAISRVSESELPAGREPVVADFSRLAPDDRFFPYERFAALLSETARTQRELWQYADPHGLPELRAEIARRLAATGASRDPDHVLVTSGAQQGLDLLFKTLVDPGDLVAVESPTYPGILPLLRFYGARVVEMPVRESRRDLSALDGRAIKLAYVMPERHNPTGVTMDEEERRRFLAVISPTGALIVEDGYETPTSGVPPLSALDPLRVATLGSFSKELVPGFRLGWIAANPRVVRALALAKQTTDLRTPPRSRRRCAPSSRKGVTTRRGRRARRKRGAAPGAGRGARAGDPGDSLSRRHARAVALLAAPAGGHERAGRGAARAIAGRGRFAGRRLRSPRPRRAGIEALGLAGSRRGRAGRCRAPGARVVATGIAGGRTARDSDDLRRSGWTSRRKISG
jgi:GntR family transcriptional regulator/MocR family aminotransferase